MLSDHNYLINIKYRPEKSHSKGGKSVSIVSGLLTTFTLGDRKRVKSEGRYKLSMLNHGTETNLVVDVIDADLSQLIARGRAL